MGSPDTINSNKILGALAKKYEPPEWAAFSELSVDLGSYAPRRMDFWAMHTWTRKPGLGWTVCFEVKTSRADFMREIKDPDKRLPSEELSNECWFVTPPKLVKRDEVPEGWGLMECGWRLDLKTVK